MKPLSDKEHLNSVRSFANKLQIARATVTHLVSININMYKNLFLEFNLIHLFILRTSLGQILGLADHLGSSSLEGDRSRRHWWVVGKQGVLHKFHNSYSWSCSCIPIRKIYFSSLWIGILFYRFRIYVAGRLEPLPLRRRRRREATFPPRGARCCRKSQNVSDWLMIVNKFLESTMYPKHNYVHHLPRVNAKIP